MISGFTFNGRHCNEFGIKTVIKKRPFLPATRDQYKEIPGMDGSHLFPEKLPDLMIDGIECSIEEDSLFILRQRARQIVAWLLTPARVKLILDDEPGVFYWVKLYNRGDIQQTIAFGEFNPIFRGLPYAYSVSPVVVEQDIANAGTLTLTNSGGVNTPVAIEISGSSALTNGFTLNINGDECIYLSAVDVGKTVYIDTERMTVQLDGTSALLYHDGTFSVLVPGSNTLTYTNPDTTGAHIKITYYERWL